ncbi:MAG: hypothetical protein WCK89_13795 [bacterium]
MPSPFTPPWSSLIPLIPVADHAERVSAKFWLPHFHACGLAHQHAAIFGGRPSADLTRSRLLAHTYADPAHKCLEIFLWGYPDGGRGNLRATFLQNIAAISQNSPAILDWPDYYLSLHNLGGLGISTISKLAYFHGHRFGGHPALILDGRLIKVLADGNWTGLAMPCLRRENAADFYPDYLQLLAVASARLGCPPDHLEFLLFAWGDSFR